MIRVCHSFFGADHGYPYLYAERPDEALPPLADLGRGSSAGGLCYLEAAVPGRVPRRPVLLRVGPRGRALPPGALGERLRAVEADRVRRRGRRRPVRVQADRPRRPARRLADRRRLGGRPAAEAGPRPHLPHHGRRTVATPHEAAPRRATSIEKRDRPARTRRATPSGSTPRCGLERRGREGARRGARRDPAPAASGCGGGCMPCGSWPTRADRPRSMNSWSWPGPIADPRVQAQAIRAVADLADPVFTRHRLASGPGDADLAARLAALADGRDPRVVLEVTSRSAGCAGRDPGLAAQDARPARRGPGARGRAGDAPVGELAAVLALLDGPDAGPTRALALRALADRAEPEVVDGLIARLGREPDPDRRRQYADLLARVYKTPGPWVYWGYRPAPRPANTVAWGRTEAIAGALDRALDDAGRRRPAGRAPADDPGEGPDAARDPAAPPGRPARVGGSGRDHRVAARPCRRRAAPTCWRDRRRPLAHAGQSPRGPALWPGGDEGTQPGKLRRAGRARSTTARCSPRRSATSASRPCPGPRRALLRSWVRPIRTCARPPSRSPRPSASPTRASECAGAARGPRPGRAPGGRVGRGHAGPEGGGRTAPRTRPRPRPGRAARRPRYAPTACATRGPCRWPSARSPTARRNSPRWRASPSWAGPPRARRWPTWRSGAPPPRSSPSRSRILTDWGRRPALPAGRATRARSGRGRRPGGHRAVGPLAGARAAPPRGGRLARRPGRAGPARPSSPARGRGPMADLRSRRARKARLRVQDGAAGGARRASAPRTSPAPSRRPCSSWHPATARSASGRTASSSTSEPRSSRSSRIPTASRSTSVAGPHRLAVEVASAPRPPEFHLRFRRRGSSLGPRAAHPDWH